MKNNESLNLTVQIKANLQSDLSHAFESYLPVDLIEDTARSVMDKSRERIFTPVNTTLTMLLSAIQEDKSHQRAVNIFKERFERRCKEARDAEAAELETEKLKANQGEKKRGRPRQYQSRLPKSYQQSISNSTAAYTTARKNLDQSVIEAVYAYSTDFGDLEKESWYGMRTYISDGTYLQLQDTEDIRSQYPVKAKEAKEGKEKIQEEVQEESSYPQALLQVMIRQGTGQISQLAIASRQESELYLILPMIKKMEKNSLLLADDLYNTYYHFCLILSKQCHTIVPGKRTRNYKVIREINANDQLVEIAKTTRPNYVSKEEWKNLPSTILLRRITYTYPTKNGLKTAVLYTTILDEHIKSADIVAKYTMRWDIEITIREVKTLMDINVLRSKSKNMLIKELYVSLTAYNLVRKIITQSADKVGFSPQEDIFHKCASFGRTVLLDKKGRVFFKWSPGRYGYANVTNQQTPDPRQKRETTSLSKKN